ncbi:hypothetical protein LUX29_21430 [Aureimonas altamirensis]|uniref:hypothetical protein n=1 Tax=Aureimonas altamirensis TaxID=370622 RepID=UPI001E353260|nr:hypothetical protein [Aureimonas altamirensis]UHD45517.1 hypothetical protein LUX29_21430 [Aureimonas altamirensis]
MTFTVDQKVMDELDTSLHEARMYAQVLNSVIAAIGMDKTVEARDLSADEQEQIIWVALKLEWITRKATDAFEAALSNGSEGGAV